jgi:hypothetical protein
MSTEFHVDGIPCRRNSTLTEFHVGRIPCRQNSVLREFLGHPTVDIVDKIIHIPTESNSFSYIFQCFFIFFQKCVSGLADFWDL